MSEGESAKPGSDVDKLVKTLVDSFVASWGTPEDAEATVRRYLPAWDGRYETFDDLVKIGRQVEELFGKDKDAIPDDLCKAYAGLLIGHWGPGITEAVSTNFGGLDPVQALKKLWQVFATSVDAKRKGGKATTQWTPEVDAKAREIFADLKRSRMKDTPAFERTAIKLREHGFDFSPSTVRRHLKDSTA